MTVIDCHNNFTLKGKHCDGVLKTVLHCGNNTWSREPEAIEEYGLYSILACEDEKGMLPPEGNMEGTGGLFLKFP